MSSRKSSSGRRRSARRRTTTVVISSRLAREGSALLLVILAVVSLIGLFAPASGAFVQPWNELLVRLLGWGAWLAPPLLLALALMLWMRTLPVERLMAGSGVVLVVLAIVAMFHLAGGNGRDGLAGGYGGGWFGYLLSSFMQDALGAAGTWIVLLLLALVGLLLCFNMTIGDLMASWLGNRAERAEAAAARLPADRRVPTPADPSRATGLLGRVRGVLGGSQSEPEPVILRRQRPLEGSRAGAPLPVSRGEPAVEASGQVGQGSDVGGVTPIPPSRGDGDGVDAALESSTHVWALPAIDLLADAAASSAVQLDLTAKGTRIRETLAHFGIGVKVSRIQEGPVVTQYALEVEPGIKLSRIEGLADNLALALTARSIRIQAPIPGEPYVGIEIPNAAFDLVTLKEVLGSSNFEAAGVRSKLAFALGQDVAGQPFSADLSRMPHVLIAGATGSGKSVCVNAIICSLLMRATPAEVKLILIDPKRVEMALYRGLPHLLTEVIVDTDKAVNALKWTVGTMEGRYHEFAQRGVRNIAGYNEALRAGEPRMPYIVVVIDELADLMMISAYEVEATVTRIAQLARATGIHLVVATQRPSVQVITGLIKANIPSRIAFAMTSGIDSRTILDTIGAEDLLGRGDMLYQPIDAPRAVRLQGVLVTDPEIEELVRHWRAQGGPAYRPEITAPRRDRKGATDDESDRDADPLLSQAVEIVRRSDKASASLLQRRLRVGYARAARILDQMEDRGIVGPADGSRFREVLVTPDGWGGEGAPDRDAE